MDLEAYKVDAFTTTPYTGNAAGVLPQAEGLGEAQMQALAREMNVSETAFVLPSERADLRLRYFTPSTEVPLCGHATVAAFHVLAQSGRVEVPARLRVETGVGVLDVEVREGPETVLTSDPLFPRPSPWSLDEVGELLGAPRGTLDEQLPLMVLRDDLLVPVKGLRGLGGMRPDFEALAKAGAAHGIQGFIALTTETHDKACRTHLRYFAPGVGIPEDPVTGVAHMALGRYLVHVGLARPGDAFWGEQGHFVGRPGRVRVELDGTPDLPVVRVGGRAVTVLEGRMHRPTL